MVKQSGSSEKIYPERQRCKTCRKKLESIILEGMFCSNKCGKLTPAAKTIAEAPRGCKRQLDGKWDYKTRYVYPNQVPEKFKADPTTNIYLCDNCHCWHIGHSRPEEYESLTRYVSDVKELGSTIKRHRETLKLDKKTIATKLKVPIIRITEVEEGSPKASISILFKILEVLKLRVSVINLKVRK